MKSEKLNKSIAVRKIRNRIGFTLVELLISIAIISLLLPGVVSVLFMTVRSYTRVLLVQEVKRAGDGVLDILGSRVRSDIWAIYSDPEATIEVCTNRSISTTPSSAPSPLYFRRQNGTIFYFSVSNGELDFVDNGVTSALTNSKVAVSAFALSCLRTGSYSPPIIDISFAVSQAGSLTRSEEVTNLSYQTKIKLRQY